MKHQLLWVLLILAGIQSCSVSKAARSQRNLMSGTWNLTDVSYADNQGAFQATLFNDADAICFEDSEWFFRDNNSTGRYTITPGSLCSGGDRFFRWSVVERPENYNSTFQFKFIDENRKDISGGVGYTMTIEELTETTMRLRSNVQVDGEPLSIIYNFSKK